MMRGSPAEAATELVRVLREDARVSSDEPMILVIAEQRDGALNRASWEAIARRSSCGGPSRRIAVAGRGTCGRRCRGRARGRRSTEVITLEHPALARYTADGFAPALASLIARRIAVASWSLPHTYQTRDFAPQLAARLDRALVTDCVGVQARRASGHVFVRPMFQGKVHADVVLEGPAPHLVTMQIGAFRADAVKKGAAPAPCACPRRSMPR